MPIDASIAMGYKAPDFGNPINSLANIMQLQGAQQANQLTGLKLQQAQAEGDRKNKLYALMNGLPADATDDQRSAALKGAGFFDQADALDKNILERGKVKYEGMAKQATALKDYTSVSRDLATSVMAQPTIENAMAAIKQAAAYHKALGFGDLDTSNDERALSQMTSPDQIKQWAAGHALQAEKLLPKLINFNAGDREVVGTQDPLSGKFNATGSSVINQSPDNKASVNASMANAAATREVAQATRDAANVQRDQNTEMKLADDYRTQSKDFQQATSAFKQINATLDQATKSPAATLAAATKFMKILDPGSVVRESELGMALAATGVIDRAQNYINTLQSGKVLTESQVKDFRKITGDMYEAAKGVQKQIDADYTNKAKSYKLRPENVVQNLGQNDAPSASPLSVQTPDGQVHTFPNAAAAAAFKKAAGL